jgi:PAS domain S-box-containing protein
MSTPKMTDDKPLSVMQRLVRSTRTFALTLVVLVAGVILFFGVQTGQLTASWTLFLVVVLVITALLESTRLTHAEWVAVRRTAQVQSLKAKLEHEQQQIKSLSNQVSESKPRLHLMDEVLATMVILVDAEGICRYFNRAFLDWLHLRSNQVGGKHLREVLGAKVYEDLATANRKSLEGRQVQYEYTKTMDDGALYKLSIQHVPQFGVDGKVTGFYMILTDITQLADVHLPHKPVRMLSTIPPCSSSQNLFIDSFAEQVMGEKDAATRIMTALEKGEFRLFCQLIRPLSADAKGISHHEILIRLLEEEENMMPPGAFFPLAERCGLMPYLDRWVVRHVVKLIANQRQQGIPDHGEMFFVNVSAATIADVGFPEFLQCALLEYKVSGTTLCFEIPDSEQSLHHDEVVEFIRRVRLYGCRIALSGFGRVRVYFEEMENFDIDFLKIDGGIVLEILRDPVALAKAVAIQRVAKELGLQTIAEFVEQEEIVTKLVELGIDFAQGFGISHPTPLMVTLRESKRNQ